MKKFVYPNPDTLSDAAIREALANNGIEGYDFVDENGVPVAPDKRVEAFREYIRCERARQLAEIEAEKNSGKE